MRSLLKLCPGTTLDDFVISHGCAIALLGLRETFNDIDLAANEETFKKLIDAGYEVNVRDFDKPVIQFGSLNIDVHLSPEYFEQPSEYIDYLGFIKLRILAPQGLLEEKQKLNREKDQKDIEALKAYIAKRNEEGEASEQTV